jgi:hypothetical protein
MIRRQMVIYYLSPIRRGGTPSGAAAPLTHGGMGASAPIIMITNPARNRRKWGEGTPYPGRHKGRGVTPSRKNYGRGGDSPYQAKQGGGVPPTPP